MGPPNLYAIPIVAMCVSSFKFVATVTIEAPGDTSDSELLHVPKSEKRYSARSIQFAKIFASMPTPAVHPVRVELFVAVTEIGIAVGPQTGSVRLVRHVAEFEKFWNATPAVP